MWRQVGGPHICGPYKWAEVYNYGGSGACSPRGAGSLRRNSETFLCYFLLVTKESNTSRETAVKPLATYFPRADWIYCLGVWLYSALNAL